MQKYGLINEYNSLHVNMYQTDQLATVECEVTTWKSLICSFLEYVIINIDTQIVPLFFCLQPRSAVQSIRTMWSILDQGTFISPAPGQYQRSSCPPISVQALSQCLIPRVETPGKIWRGRGGDGGFGSLKISFLEAVYGFRVSYLSLHVFLGYMYEFDVMIMAISGAVCAFY